jgi:hypothetical protein
MPERERQHDHARDKQLDVHVVALLNLGRSRVPERRGRDPASTEHDDAGPGEGGVRADLEKTP